MVKVSNLRSHAVQLGPSRYRLLCAEPTQLVVECHNGTRTSTVEGAYMVRLSVDCPEASTPDYIMRRTPSTHQLEELIQLPLIERSQKWLDEMTRELNAVATRQSVEWHLRGDKTIPLPSLRESIEIRQLQRYRSYYEYFQLGALIIVLSYVASKGLKALICGCKRRGYGVLRGWIFRTPPTINEDARADAGEVDLIDMRNLAVPFIARERDP